jgi:hypothetical protein
MAADEIARNIVWLRNLCKELGFEQEGPTTIYEDNQACIRIAEGGGSFQARKHMHLRFCYLTHLVQDNVITMKHIASDKQTADLLTKLLGRHLFQSLIGALVRNIKLE